MLVMLRHEVQDDATLLICGIMIMTCKKELVAVDGRASIDRKVTSLDLVPRSSDSHSHTR